MSLPLGLYGLPPSVGNPGEETAITQASNEAYAEFRRQMLSQVNATKTKRKGSNSRPNSVTDDDSHCHSHNGQNSSIHANDGPMIGIGTGHETTIRGTVSVTDLRLVNHGNNSNEDDSQHSANDESMSMTNGTKSPLAPHGGDIIGVNRNSTSPLVIATTSNGGKCMTLAASDFEKHFANQDRKRQQQQQTDLLNGIGTDCHRPGSSNGSAKKRGRNGEEIKDEAYWERRRKNNEAAKRSRDARRAKEDEIAIRAAFLEQENLKLRFELANLKNETAKLRCMIYNS